MSEDRNMRSKPGEVGAAAAALASVPDADHEEIARLAYTYWEGRGCPEGSPEEDWFRAEKELRPQTEPAGS